MKKLFISVVLVSMFLFAGTALADWSVTTTWTRSPDSNLNYEEVLLDGVMQGCTIDLTDPTTCTFVVEYLNGQVVTVRSYNTQGVYSDYEVGTLFAVPTPASGGSITIVYTP